jgi:membrane-associated protease RseP (regulator of RpoE activity)
VLVKVVYWIGHVLAVLVGSVTVLAVGIAAGVREQDRPIASLLWFIALLLVGLPVVVVVHEAGHLLACLALRAKVLGVEIGNGKSPRLSFTAAGIEVSLGVPYSGRVLYDGASLAGRRAIITAAGALANLVAAAVLFSACQRWNPIAAAPLSTGQEWNPVAAAMLFAVGHAGNLAVLGLALLMTLIGVTSLLPYRTRNGRPSDGARLLALAGGPFAAALRQRDAKGLTYQAELAEARFIDPDADLVAEATEPASSRASGTAPAAC